jgi:hypothetical protein
MLLSVMMFLSVLVYSQPGYECSKPITLEGDSTCYRDSLKTNEERWFSFKVSSPFMEIQLIKSSMASAYITKVEIFSGGCSSLDTLLVDSIGPFDSTRYSLPDFIPGSYYIMRISRQIPPSCAECEENEYAAFKLCSFSRQETVVSCNCSQVPVDANYTCQAICNGDFEYHMGTLNNISMVHLACPWRDSPSTVTNYHTTADYFSTTSNSINASVPTNLFGTQASYTNPYGSNVGYAGIICFDNSQYPNYINYREYIQQPINTPLIAGKDYRISFRISLADNSGFSVNNIGAWLTAAQPVQSAWQFINPPSLSSIQALESSNITNDTGWQLVSGIFTASGNEQWITIGQFTDDFSCNVTAHTPLVYTNSVSHLAYYYIDSVSIVPDVSLDLSGSPNPFCYGDTLTLTAQTSAVGAYFFTWSQSSAYPGDYLLSNNNSTIQAISNGGSNTYQCVIHLPDYNGCTMRDTTQVKWMAGPGPFEAVGDTTVCPGQPVILSGPPTPYTTSTGWHDEDGNLLCGNCPTYTVYPTSSTSYAYSATNATTGCAYKDFVYVNMSPPPVVSITGPISTCDSQAFYCPGQQIAGYTYAWAFWDQSYSTSIPYTNTQLTNCVLVDWLHNANGEGGHVVLTVTYGGTCTATDTFDISPCCADTSGNYWYNVTFDSPQMFSGITQYINGTLTINANTLFDGCTLKMGGQAKIVVQNGATLELKKTLVEAGCCEMWDAIEGTSSSDQIIVHDLCYIGDATRGIVSNNGAVYTIYDNVFFNRNLVSITVNPYAGTHSGTVESTIFDCITETYCPSATLIYPLAGQWPKNGIYIENVDDITIGNASVAYASNLFRNLKNGIYSKESNVNVYNEYFENIDKSGNNSKAVEAIGKLPTLIPYNPTQYILNVGGVVGSPSICTFQDCPVGVYTDVSMITFVQGCLFDQNIPSNQQTLRGTAVEVNNSNGFPSQVRVEDNTILNCKIGYKGYMNTSTKTLVRNNTISRTTTGTTDGEGVYIVAGGANSGTNTVFYNSIYGYQFPVLLSNINNAVVNNNFLSIRPSLAAQYPARGIMTENCTGTNIINNTINMDASTTAPVSSKWNGGIYVSQSNSSVVSCNDISDIGYGIEFTGTAVTSAVVSRNTMNNTDYGIWLDEGAVIGPQGITSMVPSDNRWFGSVTYRLYTSGLSSSTSGVSSPFYYRPGSAFWPSPSGTQGTPNTLIPVYSASDSAVGQVACELILPPDAGHRYSQLSDPADKGQVAESRIDGQQTAKMTIYPNPSKGTLIVNLDDKGGKFELYNSLGQVVYSANITQSCELNFLENIPDGIYIIRFSGSGYLQTDKLIIQRN